MIANTSRKLSRWAFVRSDSTSLPPPLTCPASSPLTHLSHSLSLSYPSWLFPLLMSNNINLHVSPSPLPVSLLQCSRIARSDVLIATALTFVLIRTTLILHLPCPPATSFGACPLTQWLRFQHCIPYMPCTAGSAAPQKKRNQLIHWNFLALFWLYCHYILSLYIYIYIYTCSIQLDY